jgi:hypothetical protein
MFEVLALDRKGDLRQEEQATYEFWNKQFQKMYLSGPPANSPGHPVGPISPGLEG